MKMIFSKEEVLYIVLQHVRCEFPRAQLNTAEIEGYGSFTAVAVSYEDTPMAIVNPGPAAEDSFV